ncbi:hypothetical protein BCR43DRAFT_448380, partial [Syncephalastrum racemosum]
YDNKDKEKLIHLMATKTITAAAAAVPLGIHQRTAQRWAAQYEKDPDTIFERKKRGPKPVLGIDHKKHIMDVMDNDCTIVVSEVTDSLTSKFQDLKISKSTVHNFMKTECNLSIKMPKERTLQLSKGDIQ